MPMRPFDDPLGGWVPNVRAEARVWSAPIVVSHPRAHDMVDMALVERNQPIQTLAPDCANQAFAEGVPLRRPNRPLENRLEKAA